MQTRLYRMAQRGELLAPANPPGFSLHERGLAFDLVVNHPWQQTELGRVWRSWGLPWYPHDPIHFEFR